MAKDPDNLSPRSALMEPGPMDTWVGTRVRLRRAHMSMSATHVATEIGVTRVQYEKYERGETRITCGKLYDISRALDIHPGWFFDEFTPGKTMGGYAEELNKLATPENIEMLTSFTNLLPDQRKSILLLANACKFANLFEARREPTPVEA